MPAPDIGPRLIDSSVWIRADRKGHDALQDRVKELLTAGSAWICWPIRAELLIDVKTPERWVILNEQLAALEQATILDRTWERAARLGHQLARKGQRVPLPDLLIAATALLHGLPLWSVDSDFKRIAAVAPLDLDLFGADQARPPSCIVGNGPMAGISARRRNLQNRSLHFCGDDTMYEAGVIGRRKMKIKRFLN